MSVLNVSVDHLEENTWNPNVMSPDKFEELQKDVVAGNYNPVTVSPKDVFYGDPELPSDRYVIVDGKHRWVAAIKGPVGYIDIDVKPMTEAEAKVYCYRRNSVKGDIDPMKEGELFNLDVEELGSEEAVAERYGRSRSYVASRRALTRVAEPVKEMLQDVEKGFTELKKEELAADIVASNPQEEYTADQVEEMVEASLEEQDLVPRGTLTHSHVEAIAGLPEEAQKQVAVKIVEKEMTVRDTEKEVKFIQETTARRARFEAALERAVQKTCPECGAPPSDFEEKYDWSEGVRIDSYDEDCFECSKVGYHDWPYMKKARSKEKQLEKAKKERSKKLSAARLNPKYIRREEERDDLIESMRPWVLRKIRQLDEIGTVSIKGLRGDKVVSIDFPSNYGAKLFVRIGDSEPGEYHDRFYSMAEKRFGFDIERKLYKTLPFNSKLDLAQGPSPENRAQVHHFLDHILNTDEDPFLPEDEELVKNIMRKYGELEEEPEDLEDPVPHEEPETEEAEEPIPLEEEDKAGSEEIYNVIDKILDQILDNEHDRVKVDVTGIDAEDTVNYFEMRISARAITGNVEVYEGEDGEVYLERLKSKVEEVG